MEDISRKSPTPPSPLLSDETKSEIARTVRSVKDDINEVINAGWDVEGFAPDSIPSAMDKMLDRLARASRAQQITAGGVSGWITGFLFNKFGKPVLYLAGGTLIIALFAEHQGYLKIDWHKVRTDYSTGRRAVQDRIHTLHNKGILARKNGKPWLQKMKIIAQSSPYLSGGFVGGILLGLAS